MEKAIKCAIYPRKSKQNDNSESMEVQIQMCKDYIAQNYTNYTITVYDKDYGVTGHSTKARKDFQRMMDDVRANKINLVVIQRYDRIARNTRDFCNLYHDMEEVGCNLVSVSQRIDTSTPYGKKFMYDLASTAELEWALNSERHKDTNRYARLNRKCALSPYALPFGITAEIRDGKRVAVIDKEREHIVRDAINYYKENKSKQKTTRYINSKYNLKLSHSFMTNLIKSDFYHGQYREVPDYCEAYMTLEEHEELRNINKQYVRHYSSDKQYFLFTGLLICPCCGLKMESQSQLNKSGSRYYYYRCYNTYRTGKCSFKGNVNEKVVETYLLENLEKEMSDFSTRLEEKRVKTKEKTVDLSKLKEEMERLNKLYIKGRIEEDFYNKEYERLQKEISLGKSEITNKPKYNIENFKEFFPTDWKEKYVKLSREIKRNLWKEIISSIEINNEKTVERLIFK